MERVGAVTSTNPPPGPTPRWLSRSVALAGLFGVYFLAGKLGLSMAFLNASASPVWPPTGIAVAAVLVMGRWVWPAVFVGAFFVNLTTQGTTLTSLGIATGNTLEALVIGELVQRYAGGRRVFETPGRVARYALLALPLGAAVSATIGVTVLAAGGFAPWDGAGPVWLTWWLGDLAGGLLLAPPLVLWANDPRPQWRGRRAGEAAIYVVALALFAAIVLLRPAPGDFQDLPLGLLATPLAIWAAFRFGSRESTTATLVIAGLATWSTLNGFGPFVGGSTNESLLFLQAFFGVISATTLPLAAVERERARGEASLREARDALDERVRERTADLERAVRELETFTYAVAHDLRGPVRAMEGHAAILLEKGAGGDEEARGHLRRIEASGGHLGELIESLL